LILKLYSNSVLYTGRPQIYLESPIKDSQPGDNSPTTEKPLTLDAAKTDPEATKPQLQMPPR
jgi:hypothetical protein